MYAASTYHVITWVRLRISVLFREHKSCHDHSFGDVCTWMFIRQLRQYTTTPPFTVPEKVIVQRVGAFRGGLVGFMMGLSASSALCYVYLLEEYQSSTNSLLSSIEDLQKTTIKVAQSDVASGLFNQNRQGRTRPQETLVQFRIQARIHSIAQWNAQEYCMHH